MSAGGVWSALLVASLALLPALPWATLVAAALLFAMWRYLAGDGPPRSSSAARRRSLRATTPEPRVFAWALTAGGLGVIALAGLWPALMQLGEIAGRPALDFAAYPALTVASFVVTGAVVTAVAEEAAIRGYLLSALERALPAAAAIVIAAVILAPGHAFTQGFAWPVLLFYLVADVMFGALAYLSRSILPGIAVHVSGLVVFFALVWPADASRAALPPDAAQTALAIAAAQSVLFGAMALVSYRSLRRATERGGRLEGPPPPTP